MFPLEKKSIDIYHDLLFALGDHASTIVVVNREVKKVPSMENLCGGGIKISLRLHVDAFKGMQIMFF